MILSDLVRKLEGLRGLDPVAGRLASAVSGLTEPTPVKNALTGVWLGHPAHPLLTDLPIGSWACAGVLDVMGGKATAAGADALVALGVGAAVPTVATGAADWADYNDDRARRVGLVHALLNTVALVLHIASLLARRRGRRGRGVALSLTGLAAVTAGGYLGGHLAYRLASGVDRTTFDEPPDDWEDVLAEASLSVGRPRRAQAGGVGVVLVSDDGLHALADRCSHMGGPLHEGELVDGCIRCPWHGSTFRLADGSVARGPAAAPQPRFETRLAAGRVQVRAAHRPNQEG